MIILSQNKMMLINFDNISGIVIRKNNEDNMWQLQCKANEENKRILGKYKTEERAKEVLQDIITCYTGDGIVEYNGFICFEIPEK
jgi:ribonucleotide reductase beta subunit family protein with ferritin-like domain